MASQYGDRFATGRVPQSQGAVIRGRDDVRAIRTENGLNGMTGVPFQNGDRLAAGRVPDPHRLILGRRSNSRAVRAEGDGADPVPMPGHDGQKLALGQVPDANRVIGIIPSCGEPPAIGAHGTAKDRCVRDAAVPWSP